MQPVTALILAGGMGTRLREVLPDRPKVLAEVRGRPFLSYLLDQLLEAGITDAVLCVGYLAEQVRQTFGPAYRDLRLQYSVEYGPLGTGGALRLAAQYAAGDTVLAMNGDSYIDVDLVGLRDFHHRRRASLSIILAHVPDTRRFGRVQVGSDDRVEAFEEKGGPAEEGWVNAGIYLMEAAVLRAIPAGRAVSLEREVLPACVGKGLLGFRSAGRLLDIGTPESYAAAAAFFADNRRTMNTKVTS